MSETTRVTIIDVSPRDGLQNEAAILSVAQKIELCDRLADTGVQEIEFGSFVSPKAVPQMAGTDEVFTKLEKRPGIRYLGLVPNMRGYDISRACGVTDVRLVVAATEPLHQANFRRPIAESLADHALIIERAKADGVSIEGVIGGSFGDPFKGPTSVDEVLRCVDHYYANGVRSITVADTVGMGTPLQIRAVIKAVQSRYPDITLGTHLHDTRSTGLANLVTAIELGVLRHDSAMGGTGGCPFAPKAGGNICTEDVVHMLYGMGIETGIDLDSMIRSSLWLEEQLGKTLPSKLIKADPVYPKFKTSQPMPALA